MPTIALKKIDGSEAGQIQLADEIFAAPQNGVLVREALNAYMANQRQGTHSTRTRGMVRGGGRKPWKQKGTGRARQGSIRAAQWRGGAVIFGPQPRDYSEKINRRKRQAALRAVLSARREEGRLIITENLDLPDLPKTKRVVEFLEAIGAEGRVLVLTEVVLDNFAVSARNIPFVAIRPINEINVYDLLLADTVIMTKAAVQALEETAK